MRACNNYAHCWPRQGVPSSEGVPISQAAKAGEASLLEAQQLRLESQRLQDRSEETNKKLLHLVADMQESVHVLPPPHPPPSLCPARLTYTCRVWREVRLPSRSAGCKGARERRRKILFRVRNMSASPFWCMPAYCQTDSQLDSHFSLQEHACNAPSLLAHAGGCASEGEGEEHSGGVPDSEVQAGDAGCCCQVTLRRPSGFLLQPALGCYL